MEAKGQSFEQPSNWEELQGKWASSVTPEDILMLEPAVGLSIWSFYLKYSNTSV